MITGTERCVSRVPWARFCLTNTAHSASVYLLPAGHILTLTPAPNPMSTPALTPAPLPMPSPMACLCPCLCPCPYSHSCTTPDHAHAIPVHVHGTRAVTKQATTVRGCDHCYRLNALVRPCHAAGRGWKSGSDYLFMTGAVGLVQCRRSPIPRFPTGTRGGTKCQCPRWLYPIFYHR